METWATAVVLAIEVLIGALGGMLLKRMNDVDSNVKEIRDDQKQYPEKFAKAHARISMIEGEIKGLQAGQSNIKERHDRLEDRFDEHVRGNGYER